KESLRMDPFNNNSCDSSGKLDPANIYHEYNMTYSKMACRLSCLSNMQIKRCGCSQFRFTGDRNIDYCVMTNETVDHCIDLIKDDFLNGACNKQCPPSCSDITFSRTVSTYKWPANRFKDELLESVRNMAYISLNTTEEIRDNLLELHIYYADMDYELVEETLKYGVSEWRPHRILLVFMPRKLDFPVVTICNQNILRKSKITTAMATMINKIFNVTAKTKTKSSNSTLLHSISALPHPDAVHSSRSRSDGMRSILSAIDFKELKSMGHQLEDMVVDCSFNSQDCSIFEDETLWRHIWIEDMGNCYMFNPAMDKKGLKVTPFQSVLSGDQHGLTLTINLEQYEYLDSVTAYAGLKVIIGRQREMPFPISEGISVAPGLSNSIEIKKNHALRLDPFRNHTCEKTGELEPSNIYRRFNMSYSKMACRRSCLVNMQTSRCNCSQFEFTGDYEFCDFANITVDFNESSCAYREVYFTNSISSSKWPALNFKKLGTHVEDVLCDFHMSPHLLNFDVILFISENMLEIRVYYAELDYVRVEETLKYKLEDLMSNVGGQMGMWIGLSVLTIGEVIEVIWILIRCLLKKNRNNKAIHVNHNDELEFPVVTLCNTNQLRKSQIPKLMEKQFENILNSTLYNPGKRLTDSRTHGLTDSRIHGLTDSRTHGLTDSRTHGLTDSRTHGLTDSRTHGLTDSRTHGLTDSRTHGLTDSRTHGLTDSRTHGLTDSRTHGLTDSRIHGLTDSRTHGLTDSRTHGLTDSRTHGLTDSRTHGLTDLTFDDLTVWRPIWIEDVGNCYMFNRALDANGIDVEPIKSSVMPGKSNGLKLLLNTEQYEYFDGITPDAGFFVVIGVQGEMPFPLFHGINVAPGLSTSLKLRKSCTYSCLALKEYARCNCSRSLIPDNKDEDGYCDNMNKTIDGVEGNFIRADEQTSRRRADEQTSRRADEQTSRRASEHEQTSSRRADEQTSRRADEQTSRRADEQTSRRADEQTSRRAEQTSRYFSSFRYYYIIISLCSDNLLELHIYYADLDYVLVQEIFKFQFQDLISNIGGQMGMWIGLSVLTIGEMLELICILAHNFIERKKTSGANDRRINVIT
ncbi:hypothetical protein QZH41_012304, partial [Actinostola sp. cb2023]